MKTHNFIISFLDTDSIAFSKPDGSPFSEEEQLMLLADLNSNFPPKIRFEHDGVFSSVVILKAKNYILNQNGKLTKKGSSLKSSKTEPRMKDFMGEVIDLLISNNKQEVINVYNKYCKEILTLTDITPYCSKKTITTSVVNPSRTNEQKVLDALHGQQVSMGDKIYLYYAEETR
jgi:DNA polymerase elongation subunit (family B)